MPILSRKNETIVLAVAGIAVAYTGYRVVKGAASAGEAVKEVFTEKLNPVSDKNLAYEGASKVTETLTGGKHKELGSYMFCLFNSDAIVCNPELLRVANERDVSFYIEDKEGNKIINPQLTQLFEQEKEFLFEEDVL